MGPAAGAHGGEVVAQGTPAEVARDSARSLGAIYREQAKIPSRPVAARGAGEFVTVTNAAARNLKKSHRCVPHRRHDLRHRRFRRRQEHLGDGGALSRRWPARLRRVAKPDNAAPRQIVGWENFDARHRRRSNAHRPHAALQSGDLHRNLRSFARALCAIARSAACAATRRERFSFNVSGGRCEACAGEGVTRVEMHFLPEMFVTCECAEGGATTARPWRSNTRG